MLVPALLVLAASALNTCAALTISPPSGTYQVQYSTLQLTDFSRKNPGADKPPYRSIMTSTFIPTDNETTCQTSRSPYMPLAVAEYYDDLFSPYGIPNDTFESIDLAFCPGEEASSPAVLTKDIPTIIFSPGLGNSRFLYSIMASAIASRGFNVVTIDHPYDAPLVAFPDGSVVVATNISTEAQITKAMEVRSDDILFVASLLHNNSALPDRDPSVREASISALWHYLLETIFRSFQNHRSQLPKPIFAAGHSLGGAAAIDAARRSPGIRAAVNLDGSLWGAENLPRTTLSAPVLLFRRESNASKPTWSGIWPRLLGPKLELELMHSMHGTFTDLPFLIDALGLREGLGEGVSELLGRLPGVEAVTAIAETMATWCQDFGHGTAWRAVDATAAVARERGDVVVVR